MPPLTRTMFKLRRILFQTVLLLMFPQTLLTRHLLLQLGKFRPVVKLVQRHPPRNLNIFVMPARPLWLSATTIRFLREGQPCLGNGRVSNHNLEFRWSALTCKHSTIHIRLGHSWRMRMEQHPTSERLWDNNTLDRSRWKPTGGRLWAMNKTPELSYIYLFLP